MIRTITLFLSLSLCLSADSAHAQSASNLLSCNFGQGDTTATVSGNRVITAAGGRYTLKRKAGQIECADTNADGIDEIISFTKAGARTVTTVRRTKKKSLKTFCKKVRSLTRGEIWKSRASDHINDQRKFSTSFITLRSTGAPRNSCLSVYDKKGNLIHKLGQYFPSGAAYSSRYYGGYGCGDKKSAATVAAIARKNTGSPEGYVTSGTGNCLKISNLNACFNSSAC